MADKLWKVLPPFLSDVLGMQAVLDQTGGIGVVDDSSRYKPLTRGSDSRVVNSEIRNADIVYGTEKKVFEACKSAIEEYHPDFILLSHAPSSAMIGSDLELVASQVEEEYDIPVAAIKTNGEKDYLYGISLTLEAMGKLLLQKEEPVLNGVNILGCNSVDWTEEMLSDTEKWLAKSGYEVISRWGMRESTEALKHAAAASLNLVVNVSGLRLARYMEKEFGIRYVIGAPFGRTHCNWIQAGMLSGGHIDSAGLGCETDPGILIVGEQLLGNALRRTLYVKGLEEAQVVSFFDLDRMQMSAGDEQLFSEDDLTRLLNGENLQLVIADKRYQRLCTRDIPWIDLPDRTGMIPDRNRQIKNLIGDRLDEWLDAQLIKVGLM